jgi:hypothetical protein
VGYTMFEVLIYVLHVCSMSSLVFLLYWLPLPLTSTWCEDGFVQFPQRCMMDCCMLGN